MLLPAAQQEPKLLLIGQFIHVTSLRSPGSGGLLITTFSILNANISRTRSDIEKRSTAFFPISSDLTSEINKFFGRTFPFTKRTQKSFLLVGYLTYCNRYRCVGNNILSSMKMAYVDSFAGWVSYQNFKKQLLFLFS